MGALGFLVQALIILASPVPGQVGHRRRARRISQLPHRCHTGDALCLLQCRRHRQAPTVPVFYGERINLLMVRTRQPLFSAALIAWVESRVADVEEKNELCATVPSPEQPIDWLRMAATLENGRRWRHHEGLSAWLAWCRLNLFAVFMRGVAPDDTERLGLIDVVRAKAPQAEEKLAILLAASEGKESP